MAHLRHRSPTPAMPTNAELHNRCNGLEAKIDEEVAKGMKASTHVTQTNLLSQQMKAYDKNIKNVGMTYDIKDSRTFNKEGYEAWASHVIKTALVDTKVVKHEDLFVVDADGNQKLMRGIISDIHPLGNRSNAAIVVAFNEASFAHQIRETIRKNQGYCFIIVLL